MVTLAQSSPGDRPAGAPQSKTATVMLAIFDWPVRCNNATAQLKSRSMLIRAWRRRRDVAFGELTGVRNGANYRFDGHVSDRVALSISQRPLHLKQRMPPNTTRLFGSTAKVRSSGPRTKIARIKLPGMSESDPQETCGSYDDICRVQERFSVVPSCSY